MTGALRAFLLVPFFFVRNCPHELIWLMELHKRVRVCTCAWVCVSISDKHRQGSFCLSRKGILISTERETCPQKYVLNWPIQTPLQTLWLYNKYFFVQTHKSHNSYRPLKGFVTWTSTYVVFGHLLNLLMLLFFLGGYSHMSHCASRLHLYLEEPNKEKNASKQDTTAMNY